MVSQYVQIREFHSIMESDWSKRKKSHYVTEIVSWLGFADVIFGGDKRQPENIACDHNLPPLYIQTWGRRAWYIYMSDHMLKYQILVFSLIGRDNTYNTLRSYWLSNSNDTSRQKVDPARRKQTAETERGFSQDEFSAALAEALRNFQYDSLKVEQIECLRHDLFMCRCFGGSAYGFRKELNLPNNSKGVGVFGKKGTTPQHLLDFRAQPKSRLIQVRISLLDSWVASVLLLTFLAALEQYPSPGSGVEPLVERFTCSRFTDCELLAVLTFRILSSVVKKSRTIDNFPCPLFASCWRTRTCFCIYV